jgi:integrase/recombinase XerC
VTAHRIGTGRLTVAELRHRALKSQRPVKPTRHPNAAAAPEWTAWMAWHELGGTLPSTLYTYGWAADKLLAAYPHLRYEQFTDIELLQVLKGFPPKSRPRAAATYRSFFHWGIRTRRITVNPTDFLPDFKKQLRPLIEVFTVEEEEALKTLPEPDGTLMALLFGTGIRKAEARMLTCKRIDFVGERLLVIDGAKGGKHRVVPIDKDSAPGLIGRLSDMLMLEGIGDHDHLWPIRPGGGSRIKHDRPIAASRMHDWWVGCVAASGVRYRKLHTTRHTYATRMRKLGLDLGDIQLLLGHASPSTTLIYAHTDTDDVRDRIAILRAGASNG